MPLPSLRRTPGRYAGRAWTIAYLSTAGVTSATLLTEISAYKPFHL